MMTRHELVSRVEELALEVEEDSSAACLVLYALAGALQRYQEVALAKRTGAFCLEALRHLERERGRWN